MESCSLDFAYFTTSSLQMAQPSQRLLRTTSTWFVNKTLTKLRNFSFMEPLSHHRPTVRRCRCRCLYECELNQFPTKQQNGFRHVDYERSWIRKQEWGSLFEEEIFRTFSSNRRKRSYQNNLNERCRCGFLGS